MQTACKKPLLQHQPWSPDQPREPVHISPCPHTLNDDYNFTKTTLHWHLLSICSRLFRVVYTLQILSMTWIDTIYPAESWLCKESFLEGGWSLFKPYELHSNILQWVCFIWVSFVSIVIILTMKLVINDMTVLSMLFWGALIASSLLHHSLMLMQNFFLLEKHLIF